MVSANLVARANGPAFTLMSGAGTGVPNQINQPLAQGFSLIPRNKLPHGRRFNHYVGHHSIITIFRATAPRTSDYAVSFRIVRHHICLMAWSGFYIEAWWDLGFAKANQEFA
jgi:hypothetical protein